jgi:PLP dependent protein
MVEPASRIADNADRVRQRVRQAADRAGRDVETITLVAVTKYVDVDLTRAFWSAGLHDLAESRPQQLWRKAEELRDLPIRWHLIGHLQTNKVRRTLAHVGLIHGGDSVSLLEAIDDEGRRQSRRVPVLLEVNVSGESSKHGFAAAELIDAAPSFADLKFLEIRGLMAMAGREGDLDAARREFRSLRTLRDRVRDRVATLDLNELSMGMSHDFEVAIEEGATIVRVGSAFLEGLDV